MRTKPLLFMLLLILVLTPASAHALLRTLSGSATFGMQQFSRESAGVEQEASSIYQQYTATAQQRGSLFDGRAGSYTLMAGFEINVLDPTAKYNGVRDPEVSAIRTDKIYYDGRVQLAPGGLPFRLTLFAYDNTKSSFVFGNNFYFMPGSSVDAGATSPAEQLIPSDIYKDIQNGTHRTIGGTLLVGIRNGSYLGNYRDTLSQLPRLLIDFKQERVQDLHHQFNKTDHRMRDLAFVSLNKKENWVHFRMRDFNDYINPNNNNSTQQVMIGTIDQVLTRQWINLTNWIKVSGDLSYTSEKKINVDPTGTYQLNVMGVSRRDNMEGSILPNFTRENNGRIVTTTTEIPIGATANLNRDTLLRSRFKYNSEERAVVDGLPQSPEDSGLPGHRNLYLDNQLELLRSQQIIIKPRFEFESRSEELNADTQGIRISAEALSNERLSNTLNWLGGYALVVLRSNDGVTNSNTYVQNDIYGKVEKNLSRNLRIGGLAKLQTGTGGGRQAGSGLRFQTITGGLSGAGSTGNDEVASSYSGKLTQGNLSLFLDHRYQRVGNRLEADFEFFLAEGVTSKRSTLRHAFTYDDTGHSFRWNSAIFIGDKLENQGSVGYEYAEVNESNNNGSLTWNSKVDYRHSPNRSVGFIFSGNVNGRQNGIDYSLSEELSYRIFTRNGIVRRLLEVSEKISYEKGDNAKYSRENVLIGYFVMTFFPARYLYGKVDTEVIAYLDSSALQQVNTVETGFNFEKLQLYASYSQGRKDYESALHPESKEKRWEMKVKKIF